MDLRHKPVQVFIRTPRGSGFHGTQHTNYLKTKKDTSERDNLENLPRI
ncbi:DUF3892 domain-containing protein [Variovorax sp. RB2P76]